MKSADVAVGLLLAAAGAIVYFFVIPSQIPERALGGFGVSFFPKALVGLIIFFSLILAVQSFFKSGRSLSLLLNGWLTDLQLLLAVPVFYLIIRFLGLAAFAALITPACMMAMGERRWTRIAAVAVSLAVTTRLVIVYVLQAEPLGFW